MLMDTGSLTDIIYLSSFDKLHLPRSIIEHMHTPLTRFTGHSVQGQMGVSDDQKRARVCYRASVPPVNPGATNQESRRKKRGKSEVNTMRNREGDNSPKERESFQRTISLEEVERVPFIDKDVGKTFRVGTNLDQQHTS
ncbi:hypothetical protein LIER_42268 [Lithospermum erythrorhizon]|uniref:Uncharacterized protein n=1 Tax=Lithospermum erythrorhizon TaxID=34254 RepID=A0AAV3RLU7_LITER